LTIALAAKLEEANVWFFSGRIAKLESMNRILTESGRRRAERVQELERTLAQRTDRIEELERTVAQRTERIEELERTLAEQEHRLLAMQKREVALEEHNRELTNAATQRAARINEIEEHHRQQIEAVTAQHAARIRQLEKHNTELIEAATQRAARVHALERVVQALEVRAGELERGSRHNSERNNG
jgi:chromosome segregation ATPase